MIAELVMKTGTANSPARFAAMASWKSANQW